MCCVCIAFQFLAFLLFAGGLQAIAELLQVDHSVNGNTIEQYNITMRRYACMALTNLTFGDGTNKALLCSMKTAMVALVSQLQSPNEDLRQVAASVLRNLSWRADLASKKTLREVGSVTALMRAAMEVKKESTLKSILSALWNLSAHCSENKADICSVDGSLAFLVSTLTYKSPSKTLAIIENGGGILRNISSHIAVREDYRQVLRQQQCLQMLLKHLKSPSLTIVSNACGTLWNLSARCQEDQQALWEMGAVSMLRNLVNSKHKMISMGSAAALKNLISARPALANLESDRYKPNKPGLHVRKQRALEAEIDQNLAETCDNMESPHGSPTEVRKHDPRNRVKCTFNGDGVVYPVSNDSDPRRCLLRGTYMRAYASDNSPPDDKVQQRSVSRSGSQDSIGSAHSDISHDRTRTHHMLAKTNKLLHERQNIFERRRDPSMERAVRPSTSSSRLMQVMQEVAMHAGLETGTVHLKDPFSTRESQSAESTPPSSRRGHHSEKGRAIPVLRSSIPTYSGKPNGSSSNTHPHPNPNPNPMSHSVDSAASFTKLGQRLENLHLVTDAEPEQEKPINYSMKYSEAPQPQVVQPPVVSTNPPVSHSQGSAFVKPAVRAGNYVSQSIVNNVPAHSNKQYRSPAKAKPDSGAYNAYHGNLETETVDMPTNFSIRFAELDDDSHSADEPINYSKHYKEDEGAVDGLLPSVHDDTVRTFCTEGTPLNFSTATSMNDLSGKVPDPPRPPDIQPQDETRNFAAKYTESEHLSGTGTQSTERNTGSTVVQKTPATYPKVAPAPPAKPLPPSDDSSQAPSLYSYNDSTSASSPSEKPTRYCTEGTPTCFSRVSSLSSLHSLDSHSSHSKDDALQSIDENDSLDTSQNVTLKPQPHDDSFQSANTSASHGESTGSGVAKSVTFDSNVQETPLMFSRCSSLGSLSSFDAHSVHSSVVSDYSRRASEVVSPSELPDSPSDTMPPSPCHRKSPVRFVPEVKGRGNPAKPDALPQKVLDEVPQNYATEGSPAGGLSGATSLSALTFEDEPTIQKEPEMRRVPLGQEDGSPPKADNDTTFGTNDVTVIENQPTEDKDPSSFLDDDDDVSEGEEHLLMECISLGMPTKSQKKMKRSTSDGLLKKKAVASSASDTARPAPSRVPSHIPTSQSAGMLVTAQSPLLRVLNSRYSTPTQGQNLSQQEDGLISGYDTPKKFNTEDTPLNYSATGSLSDLSIDSHTGDGAENIDSPNKSMVQASSGEQQQQVDDDDDLSCLSDDCEDEALLSEAIQLAMPVKKPRKPTPADRAAEGSASDSTKRFQYQTAGYRPPVPPPQVLPPQQYSIPRSQHDVDGASDGHDSDCMKTYAVEGTPLNFSRATSLSDLTADDVSEKGKCTPGEPAETPVVVREVDSLPLLADEAMPTVYNTEGTPMSFSRNDSLSPLPFEDDHNHSMLGGAPETPKGKAPGSTSASPRAKLVARKPGIQSPAIARLKTPGKHHRFPYEPTSTSTPVSKDSGGSGLASPQDATLGYAVEDTPMCFSQNSSLSSLDSDEHESMANRSGGSAGSGGSDTAAMAIAPKVQSMTFKVEDTPANVSGDSSLSSLSVESLSFEPTAAETALLEECINAGMPKSSHKKKKEAKPSRTTTPGSISMTKPKNEERPQAEKTSLSLDKFQLQISETQQPEAETETILRKEQKDACNQEMLQGKGIAQVAAAAAAQADTACAVAAPDDSLTFSLTGSLEIDENKLAEEAEELSIKFAELSMVASDDYDDDEKELCLGAETDDDEKKSKADASGGEKLRKPAPITTSATAATHTGPSCQLFQGKAESAESLNMGCRPLDQSGTDSDFSDIMKETLPEMSSSLVSNITLTSQDSLPEDEDEEDESATQDGSRCSVTLLQRENTVVEVFPHHKDEVLVPNDEREAEEGEEVEGALDSTLEEQNFSIEEARALEENANLILSELSMTRALSTGTLEDDDEDNDDLFIENETLSLVSNDYTSDTASEVSVTLSLSSHTPSEQASEVSSSTLSQTSSSPATMQKGPRITKPGPRILSQASKEEAPRGIRGGRKRAVPASVKASLAAAKPLAPKMTTPPKVVRPGPGPQKKSPPTGTAPKKNMTTTPPKSQNAVATGQKKTPPKTPPRVSSKAVTPKAATAMKTAIATKTAPPKNTTGPAPKAGVPPKGVTNGKAASTLKGATPTKPVTPPRVTSAKPGTTRTSSPARSGQATAQRASTATASPKASPKLSRKANGPSKMPPKAASSIPRTGLPRPGTSLRSSQEKPDPKAEAKQVTAEKAAEDGSDGLERPAPPIKQGTFTMDSPTHQNTPEISQDNTDLNGNKRASAGSVGEATVKVAPVKATPRAEIPTPNKPKPRISTGLPKPAESSSKTLEGCNSLVETSQQEVCCLCLTSEIRYVHHTDETSL